MFVIAIHEEAREENVGDAFAMYSEIKSIHLNMDHCTGSRKVTIYMRSCLCVVIVVETLVLYK